MTKAESVLEFLKAVPPAIETVVVGSPNKLTVDVLCYVRDCSNRAHHHSSGGPMCHVHYCRMTYARIAEDLRYKAWDKFKHDHEAADLWVAEQMLYRGWPRLETVTRIAAEAVNGRLL